MPGPEMWRRFDGRASLYARRWDFAPEAFDAILAITGLGLRSAVADLGAGTGVVSRHLVKRVGRVYAIEPNDEMRAVAVQQLEAFPSVVILKTVAEATGLPEQSVDMVTAGHALHWFDPEPTRREIHRILRPGGWLAVLQVPTTDADYKAELLKLRDHEGSWGVPDYLRELPPVDPSAYFDGTDFITLRFPSHVDETWPVFFERLLSYSWAPRPTQPEFTEFEREAEALFNRRAPDGKLGIDIVTEVLVKQIVPPANPAPAKPSSEVHVARTSVDSQTSDSGTAPAAGQPSGTEPSPTALDGADQVSPETAPTSPLPPIDSEGSIVARFEQVAERFPDRTAIDAEVRWTYAELNTLATGIASRIAGASPDPARPVALLIQDPPTAIAAMLGVQKAGRAYCPLSLSWPVDRLRELLVELQPSALLVDRAGWDSSGDWPADEGWQRLMLDVLRPGPMDPEPIEEPVIAPGPDSPAAIYFTTGSTGRPKGIIRSHRGILHRTWLDSSQLAVTPNDHVSLLFEVAYGAAAGDIYLALLNGASLHPYDVLRQGLPPLTGWLRRQEITHFHLPVALFRRFVDGLEPGDRFPTVRRVTPSGKLRWSDVDHYRRHFAADCRLVSQLSSTETSLLTRMLVDHETPSVGESVPVGFPVSGKELWLVDEAGRRVSDGQPGEIMVRSRYLFTGIWGDAAAAHRPTDDAWDHATGDIGRWLPDRSLEFLGRRDTRVKIRGYSVDLAVIEAALTGSRLVSQAAVYAQEGPDHELRIVAYVEPAIAGLDGRAIRASMSRSLPAYMLPAHIVLLDALPLTPNGKVARSALPPVGGERPDLATPWVAPRTEVEATLAAIWAETLGLDTVGVLDRFLDLGGDSLLATLISTRVRRELGAEVPLPVLMEAATVAQMAGSLDERVGADRARPFSGVEARDTEQSPDGAVVPSVLHRNGSQQAIEGHVLSSPTRARRERPAITPLADRSTAPLSFAQLRMWFLDRLEPDHAIYNMPASYHVRGRLDVMALERSLTEIVGRHEVLRTVFLADGGQPRSVVKPPRTLQLPVEDLQHLPRESRMAEALRLADEERRRPFDLAADPMLRAKLWRLGADEHLLLLTKHHIASDAWSDGVFWQELAALYAAGGRPDGARLPELPIQYGDFAAWQQGWLQGEVLEEELAHWRGQLSGVVPLDLPTDYPRPTTQSYRGAIHRFLIPADLTDALRALSRDCGTTLYMTLLAAFHVLLSRHAGQDDIAVGTPVASRDQLQIEGLMGLFANTLVLRGDLTGNPSFLAFLDRVRRTAIEAFEHQSLPFEQLVAELNPERHPDRHPLFQVLFQLLGDPGTPRLTGLSLERKQLGSAAARFDLELTLRESSSGLDGNLIYAADLFEAETIARLVGHFQTLLSAVVAHPDAEIGRLPLMDETERRRVLDWANGAAADFPRDRCVHELFEDRARSAPDDVVLVFGERQVSYGELNRDANRLARALQGAGVRPRDLVAVRLPRSADLIVALLAILKTGGAYLPLDPSSPVGHLEQVLAEAGGPLVLTHRSLADELPAGALPVFFDDLSGERTDADTENVHAGVTADDLVYVMFTSGSTGRPKGVEIRHRSVARLVFGLDLAGPDWHRAVLHLASVAFDASTFEIWGPLLHGGRLVIAPDGPPDLGEIEALIRRTGVQTLWLTAGLFNSIVATRPRTLDTVRTILTGGEALSVRHVLLAQVAWPATTVINGYGPTESTTFTCCHPIARPLRPDARSIPIGRPIANTRVYVLDDYRQPVPIGVAGELYIGGEGLARGYLNQPELTTDSFIADPFTPGERLYGSGDRVRWLGDGTLEFVGRFDDQVKIRGYRVEPGEVAAVLGGHPAVADAVVVAREDGHGSKELAAFVVAKGVRPMSAYDLADFLRSRLPAFMVPVEIVPLDRLPLNANGKVDRSALAALAVRGSLRSRSPDRSLTGASDVDRAASGFPDVGIPDADGLVPTISDSARILQDMWAALLGVRQVGLDDSFFDLGGHSLLAVQLFSRIEARFGRRLPLGMLFEGPTIRHLSTALDALEAARAVGDSGPQTASRTIVPIQPKGDHPPFFCVHGFGGGVLGYADLARELGPDQPFYGLQAAGVDGDEAPDSTTDQMAARYVEAMRALQPEGPYRIGGYCFGGVVALDMARQLEAAGETVALLAIIEGYAPVKAEREVGPSVLARLPAVWRNIPFWTQDYLSLGASGLARRLKRKLSQAGRRLGTRQELNSLTRGTPSPQEFVDDDLTVLPDHHFELVRLHVNALRNYRAQPFGGTISLFTAQGWTISKTLFGSLDPYHGWDKLAPGRVKLHPVAGGHRNLHLPPYVSSLAKELAECLYAVAGTGPSHRPQE